mmetsp:Transcript_36279/g.85621  ORF Transcript_36279/g.85621 Transcript_36279/m.85621 type:complete len:258 (-) Transcript_36279:2592-3365(-)
MLVPHTKICGSPMRPGSSLSRIRMLIMSAVSSMTQMLTPGCRFCETRFLVKSALNCVMKGVPSNCRCCVSSPSVSGSGSSPSSEPAYTLLSLGCAAAAAAAAPPLDGSATWKLWPSATPSGTVRSYEAPSCTICTASPAFLPTGQSMLTMAVPPAALAAPAAPLRLSLMASGSLACLAILMKTFSSVHMETERSISSRLPSPPSTAAQSACSSATLVSGTSAENCVAPTGRWPEVIFSPRSLPTSAWVASVLVTSTW